MVSSTTIHTSVQIILDKLLVIYWINIPALESLLFRQQQQDKCILTGPVAC